MKSSKSRKNEISLFPLVIDSFFVSIEVAKRQRESPSKSISIYNDQSFLFEGCIEGLPCNDRDHYWKMTGLFVEISILVLKCHLYCTETMTDCLDQDHILGMTVRILFVYSRSIEIYTLQKMMNSTK